MSTLILLCHLRSILHSSLACSVTPKSNLYRLAFLGSLALWLPAGFSQQGAQAGGWKEGEEVEVFLPSLALFLPVAVQLSLNNHGFCIHGFNQPDLWMWNLRTQRADSASADTAEGSGSNSSQTQRDDHIPLGSSSRQAAVLHSPTSHQALQCGPSFCPSDTGVGMISQCCSSVGISPFILGSSILPTSVNSPLS